MAFPQMIIWRDKFKTVHCYEVTNQNIPNFLVTYKLDLIETELRHFDVICIKESWLDQRTSDEDLSLNGYKFFRRDSVGDIHGGICVYVRDSIYSYRRNDTELPTTECVWAEIFVHSRKQLIGTFYRPPNIKCGYNINRRFHWFGIWHEHPEHLNHWSF